ncbi:MAG TPA: M23 family metallopeptidase [Draconibacterium sp.]|nr:M23 family metallopeptidase [Draconibacterium sp.]
MTKRFLLYFLILLSNGIFAQPVSVQADYNAMGDCLFSAYNNTKVPIFLNINLADLENTVFTEPLPYVKKLDPGYNSLFTLQRDPDADVPRFNYEMKVFRSNPLAEVDLKFPYLIPFAAGKTAEVFLVQNIDGFWGQEGLESWYATGFSTKNGEDVYACRNGIITEIVGTKRSGEATGWYNTWTNSITLLQDDGTLICYHNVTDSGNKLKVGEKVYAGQWIGKIANNAKTLVVLIWNDSLFSKSPRFVIPQFIIGEGDQEVLIVKKEYKVVHPIDVLGLEMSSKEKRKILSKQK